MDTEVVSSFFANEDKCSHNEQNYNTDTLSDTFLNTIDELNISLEHFKLPSKVEFVYNPTIYARNTFELYVRRYCSTKKLIMYFGMNPGPWGMSQTGVPFGEISSVRDWLGIEGPVGKPPIEIVARPVKGFECTRTEISGKRFWGLFKKICDSPEKFFETSFVYNYIPQQWMKKNGCNVTPGDCKAAEMEKLYSICDPFFIKVLELYEVEKVVAVGKFCETRAQKAIKKFMPSSSIQVAAYVWHNMDSYSIRGDRDGRNLRSAGLLTAVTHRLEKSARSIHVMGSQILYLPHPSPRTVNNNDWEQKAEKCLRELKLLQYYAKDTT